MAGRSAKHLGPDKPDIPHNVAHHLSHNDGVAFPSAHGPHDTASGPKDGARGHSSAHLVYGQKVRVAAAVDIQPRHGAPKTVRAVGVHSGMTSTAGHVLRTGGGDMSSALESGSVIGPGIGSILPARPKTFPDTKPVPGQRSRVGEQHAAPGVNHAIGVAQGGRLNLDLGKAILAAAVEGKRR